MSSLRAIMVEWVDQRIDEMLKAPPMWGSNEAVEMQVLQLVELRALALRPTQELETPRRVIDNYLAHLRQRYPSRPPLPLHRLLADAEPSEFRSVLEAFRSALALTTLAENPFEHSDLALRLTFQSNRRPSASAFTGYYEEFRRATRAIVRPAESATGRAKKDIETATDFSLEDAEVTPPNGEPAQVLLRLGAGLGQRNFEAEGRVRDALSSLVTIAEWAESAAAVSELQLDDVDQRTRTAVQALRILPRRGIATVAVGGRLVGRSRPVELHPAHEKRLLEVVGAQMTPEDFDETDEIRAIDLDRGHVVLGKEARHQCFVRPDQLGEVAFVGVPARIVGQRYRALVGRPFVLADSIDVQVPIPDD
ncbi:MAG: hypothetical protein IT373_24940 [Polyangiaceae bacterium]|nr:hypothetical protein [Polyangiaceae bacterium]